MIVEFTKSSSNQCQVTFHHQHPETKVEAIIEQFADAGIKVHTSKIIKAWIPGEETATFRVLLDEYQYDTLIRQAFMPPR